MRRGSWWDSTGSYCSIWWPPLFIINFLGGPPPLCPKLLEMPPPKKKERKRKKMFNYQAAIDAFKYSGLKILPLWSRDCYCRSNWWGWSFFVVEIRLLQVLTGSIITTYAISIVTWYKRVLTVNELRLHVMLHLKLGKYQLHWIWNDWSLS